MTYANDDLGRDSQLDRDVLFTLRTYKCPAQRRENVGGVLQFLVLGMALGLLAWVLQPATGAVEHLAVPTSDTLLIATLDS